MASTLRRCRACQHPITSNPKALTASGDRRLREAHCTHPQCPWCRPCLTRREAAARAGREELLNPVQPIPPETEAEQTREIPAVRDEIPPDQMT